MYKYMSWVAVLLWMSLIFYLSHQPANVSSELSGGVSNVIVTLVEKVAPNADLDFSNFNHIVRKNAHFIIYLVLGILVMNALRQSTVYGFKSAGIALVICIIYAISDEVHQVFIPGRSGELRDVIIDTVGSGIGIGVYLLMCSVVYKKNKSKDIQAA